MQIIFYACRHTFCVRKLCYCKSVIHDFLNYIFRTKERVFPAPGIEFNLIGQLILHRWENFTCAKLLCRIQNQSHFHLSPQTIICVLQTLVVRNTLIECHEALTWYTQPPVKNQLTNQIKLDTRSGKYTFLCPENIIYIPLLYTHVHLLNFIFIY
jgi:hypothetical protein